MRSLTISIMLGIFLAITMQNYLYAALPENYTSLSMSEQVEALVLAFERGDIDDEYIVYSLKEYGHSVLPVFYSLLNKYGDEGNDDIVESIIEILFSYPSDSSIDPIMAQLKRNKELVEVITSTVSIIYSVTRSEKAYRALIQINKKREYSSLLDDIVTDADQTKIPILIELMSDPEFGRNDLIIKRLVEIGDPKVIVPVIARELKADDEVNRVAAANALGKIGDKSVVPALKEAMKVEEKEWVKVNMAVALVKLGDFLSAEYLVNLVASRFTDQIEWGVSSLKEISGQDYGENYADWRKWFEDEKKKRGL